MNYNPDMNHNQPLRKVNIREDSDFHALDVSGRLAGSFPGFYHSVNFDGSIIIPSNDVKMLLFWYLKKKHTQKKPSTLPASITIDLTVAFIMYLPFESYSIYIFANFPQNTASYALYFHVLNLFLKA